MILSSKTEGRGGVSWREQQASLVFAKLCVTCISFLRLIPRSSFFTSTKGLNIWDLSSAASLARNIIESYCVLYYIGRDKSSDTEHEFRELLWEYHDAFERYEMLRTTLPSSANISDIAALFEALKVLIQNSAYFNTLSAGYQKSLLDGKDFKIVSNVDICKHAGISERYYRSEYKYCSAFAHTAPFSISQLDAFRAGAPDAEPILEHLVQVTTGFLTVAIRDYVWIFPDQTSEITSEVADCIKYWEQILRWEKLPEFKTYNE